MNTTDQKISDDMLAQLKPLVAYLNERGFGYWISIGRAGAGSNYCGGNREELIAVTTDLISRNPEMAELLQDALDKQLE